MSLKIFTDGGARGNPGPAAAAFVVYDDADNLQYKCGKFLGAKTNNEAEYLAVIEALSYLRNLGDLEKVGFFLDSDLVVNQLNGLFKVKEPRLRELLVKIRTLEQEITNRYPLTAIRYESVPRAQNAEADALVNETLDTI